MRYRWKYRFLSGFFALAIMENNFLTVSAAEQNKANIIIRQAQSSEEVTAEESREEPREELIETYESESIQETLEIQEETVPETEPETSAQIEKETIAEETEAAFVSVSEEEIDAYFDGMVLIGDSVMVGFRSYAMKRADTYLGRIQFLASGSFSVHNALWPINGKSVHPLYQGQQRYIWESLEMMRAKRVFLFFGLNDMNMGSLEDTCAHYKQVIANIKQTCPDAEIHVMSMTYTLRGKGKGNLNNDNIRLFNEMLKQMAAENKWGFIDIATPLSDANGDLVPAYCSDNYVHQTNAAYDVWSVALREYARFQLENTSAFPVGEEKLEKIEDTQAREDSVEKE